MPVHRAEDDPEAVEACRNYARGRCRLGDRCSRRHEGEVEQQVSWSSCCCAIACTVCYPASIPALLTCRLCLLCLSQMPVKLDEVCNNYLAGKCNFGDFCRRKHEGTPVAAE